MAILNDYIENSQEFIYQIEKINGESMDRFTKQLLLYVIKTTIKDSSIKESFIKQVYNIYEIDLNIK